MDNQAKTYWVAHCRGPNFDLLKKRGFLTFYPTIDDYVFLEVKDDNLFLTRKQTELGVMFVKDRKSEKLVVVSEEEVKAMSSQTVDQIQPGAEIKVLIGKCENMEGKVLEIKEGKYVCELRGFNRTYTHELAREEIVLREKAPEKGESTDEMEPDSSE